MMIFLFNLPHDQAQSYPMFSSRQALHSHHHITQNFSHLQTFAHTEPAARHRSSSPLCLENYSLPRGHLRRSFSLTPLPRLNLVLLWGSQSPRCPPPHLRSPCILATQLNVCLPHRPESPGRAELGLPCSLLCPWCPKQGLAHSRCLLNIC